MRIYAKVITGEKVAFDLERLLITEPSKVIIRQMCKEFVEDIYADTCIKVWFEDESEPV